MMSGFYKRPYEKYRRYNSKSGNYEYAWRERGPSQIAEFIAKYDDVNDAFLELTVKQRKILKLRFWSGFTVTEIAQIEAQSISNIAQVIKTATSRLKKHLHNKNEAWPLRLKYLNEIRQVTGIPLGYEYSVPHYIQQPNMVVPIGELHLIPNKSGCYAWIDKTVNQVVRVGKSIRLRNRIYSYLGGSDRASKELAKWYWTGADPDQKVYVAVWLSKDIDSLERSLLNEFKPPLNVHGGLMKRGLA